MFSCIHTASKKSNMYSKSNVEENFWEEVVLQGLGRFKMVSCTQGKGENTKHLHKPATVLQKLWKTTGACTRFKSINLYVCLILIKLNMLIDTVKHHVGSKLVWLSIIQLLKVMEQFSSSKLVDKHTLIIIPSAHEVSFIIMHMWKPYVAFPNSSVQAIQLPAL